MGTWGRRTIRFQRHALLCIAAALATATPRATSTTLHATIIAATPCTTSTAVHATICAALCAALSASLSATHHAAFCATLYAAFHAFFYTTLRAAFGHLLKLKMRPVPLYTVLQFATSICLHTCCAITTMCYAEEIQYSASSVLCLLRPCDSECLGILRFRSVA